MFEHYLAIALMFGVQAVDLRSKVAHGHYDSRDSLSPASLPLYNAVRRVTGRPVSADKPFVFNDGEQFLDMHVAAIHDDLVEGGEIVSALRDVIGSIEAHPAH